MFVFRFECRKHHARRGIGHERAKINAPLQLGNAANQYGTGNWQFVESVNYFDSWLWVQNGAYALLDGQFGFRSQHPGGANFLFADGSCKFLKETIDTGNPNYSAPISIWRLPPVEYQGRR